MRSLLLLLLFTLPAGGQDPTLPHVERGSCTLEYCNYGMWTACRDVRAFATHDSSKAAFTVRRRDTVSAPTGVVVTSKRGIITFTGRVTFGALDGAGRRTLTATTRDTVFVLMIAAEETDATIAFRGRQYALGRGIEPWSIRSATADAPYSVLSRPVQEWWAMVITARGDTGWIARPQDVFEQPGGCRP